MNKTELRISSGLLAILVGFSPITAMAEDNTTSAANEVTLSGADAMSAVGMSNTIKGIVDTKDTVVRIDGSKVYTDLNVGTPSKNLDLGDTDYTTGTSYYNVMKVSAQVKQLKKVLDDHKEVTEVIYNDTKESVNRHYIEDLNDLLDKLNSFDHSLSLKYDFNRKGANYIAANGTAKLEFHVQTNGYWGYDLAGDSIINQLYDQKSDYIGNQQLNNEHAQFFKVDMTEKYPGMYVLNDTDLQNPVLFMNDTEAFIIDADFRGGENFHNLVMDTIGSRDLYFYITHAHGDHYLNLNYFKTDEVKGIYYGKDEAISGPGIDGNIEDVFQRFVDAGKVIRFQDGDSISRAGKEFEVIEMSNHTTGGSQLLDVTDKLLFSGDTLGAQTFKGGTQIALSQIDNWVAQIQHSLDVTKIGTKDSRVDYIIGGHTNYLNTSDFELWVMQAVKDVQQNGLSALTANPIGQNTVVVRDGKVLSSAENLAEFVNGTPVPAISDEAVTHVASINVIDDSVKEITVYRLYNHYSGEHLYTTNEDEYNYLADIGWDKEGEAWTAPDKGDTPIYRLYNQYEGTHIYTSHKDEYDQLVNLGWTGEDVSFYSAGENGKAVYRLYNPYDVHGLHLFTLDEKEYKNNLKLGWRDEGIEFYGN